MQLSEGEERLMVEEGAAADGDEADGPAAEEEEVEEEEEAEGGAAAGEVRPRPLAHAACEQSLTVPAQSSKHNAKRTLARLEKRRLRALKKKQEEELERIREAQNANISKEGVRSCPPVVCVRARSSAPPARAARALARLTRPRCGRAQTERAKDKFAFLLAQTEIFAHFLSAGKDDSKKCALASAPAV